MRKDRLNSVRERGAEGIERGRNKLHENQVGGNEELLILELVETRFDDGASVRFAIIIRVRRDLDMQAAAQELQAGHLLQATMRCCQHPKGKHDQRSCSHEPAHGA